MKSLREFKSFPIVLRSLGHNGKIKCSFRDIYFVGLKFAVSEKHIICVLSVILSTKWTCRGVTGHDLFSERVGNYPPTEVD